MNFGYAPGDRVLVFNGDRMVREDLVFQSERIGERGITLRAPDGTLVRFVGTGLQYGHGGRPLHRQHRIVPKSEQAAHARASRLLGDREKARTETFYRGERIRDCHNLVSTGDTTQAREHAHALLAALDELDAAQREAQA